MVCILIDPVPRKCQYCFWYNLAVVGLNEEIICIVSEACWTCDEYILHLYISSSGIKKNVTPVAPT